MNDPDIVMREERDGRHRITPVSERGMAWFVANVVFQPPRVFYIVDVDADEGRETEAKLEKAGLVVMRR